MSDQMQTLLPQLLAALPSIPGIGTLVTMVLVKVTSAVIVLMTLVTGGILSRLLRSAITDSLYPMYTRNSIKYRGNLLMMLGKGDPDFPLIDCQHHQDIIQGTPEPLWPLQDKEDIDTTISSNEQGEI